MNSLNSQTNRPTEDLDAVIGRFQAWTMTQTQTKPSSRSTVSEISYEQALRATARYHRAETPAQPIPQTPFASTQQSASEPADLVEQLEVRPTASISERTYSRTRRNVPNRRKSSAADVAPQETKNRPAKKAAHSRDTFAQALRQETGLTRTESSSVRSSSLTVRLAPDESALIKARADEAQLSTSAYLRQCALEVEALRIEVRETLAKFRTPVAPSAPMPIPALPSVASPSKLGLFGGLRRWMIRRLGGQHIETVC
jgi:mobilization protein NikA